MWRKENSSHSSDHSWHTIIMSLSELLILGPTLARVWYSWYSWLIIFHRNLPQWTFIGHMRPIVWPCLSHCARRYQTWHILTMILRTVNSGAKFLSTIGHQWSYYATSIGHFKTLLSILGIASKNWRIFPKLAGFVSRSVTSGQFCSANNARMLKQHVISCTWPEKLVQWETLAGTLIPEYNLVPPKQLMVRVKAFNVREASERFDDVSQEKQTESGFE